MFTLILRTVGNQNIDPPRFGVVTARNTNNRKHHHYTYFAGVFFCCVLAHSNWVPDYRYGLTAANPTTNWVAGVD
jgi:hypothetical protein